LDEENRRKQKKKKENRRKKKKTDEGKIYLLTNHPEVFYKPLTNGL